MRYDAVFFDLDGTLLPMDMDSFTKRYFGLLAKKAAPYGYDPEKLISSVWKGTAAMVANDGSRTNEDAFWEVFSGLWPGKDLQSEKEIFDRFYLSEFEEAKDSCSPDRRMRELTDMLRSRGVRIVLATNPIFPENATRARVRWAGLEWNDFEYVTTYENSAYAKPNPKYFTELLSKLSLRADRCLMVGNDAEEDMAALKAGMDVFILTDCLINKKDADLSAVPHGDIKELRKMLDRTFS